jgi:LPXTG-motif cell wall-anchored protein
MMDDQAQTYEEKVENCENCEETESFGAILPRTGPAGFIGVALLGLLLVSLGLRRR